MAIQGTISEWNHHKGYGYISVDDQEAQVRFDLFDFEAFGHPPRLRDRVQFRLAEDEQGALKAVHVERQFVFSFPLAVAIWFVSTMVASVFLLNFPPVVLVGAIALSTVTYLIYSVDKQAQHTGGSQVPDMVFYLLNLFGGWPGALLAQSILHHKYTNVEFRFLFWTSITLNIGFYCWTLTYEGSMALASIISQLQVFIASF
ncbi:DUF1294 domain-containing protein [Vibrio sinaloensis]|uniref:Membrane protein n=1 Tax=Photobacterium sp. (strain ATCC 43367) TaxID=379097 RepID=A0A0A5HPT0_PHOS4|nr:DUF1294 domain-containing protein [Vibrio sinaloensis]KGY07542.1 membrane protein [Vibrio sinaloensis]